MSIVTEAENLLIIKDLLEDETVEYIEKLIESYRNNYSTDEITDEIFEMLYFREFHETIETAKQQLEEKGIDYNAVITERLDEMISKLFF